MLKYSRAAGFPNQNLKQVLPLLTDWRLDAKESSVKILLLLLLPSSWVGFKIRFLDQYLGLHQTSRDTSNQSIKIKGIVLVFLLSPSFKVTCLIYNGTL